MVRNIRLFVLVILAIVLAHSSSQIIPKGQINQYFKSLESNFSERQIKRVKRDVRSLVEGVITNREEMRGAAISRLGTDGINMAVSYVMNPRSNIPAELRTKLINVVMRKLL